MRRSIIVLLFALTSACRQGTEGAVAPTPQLPDVPIPLLKTEGCRVAKSRGVIAIACADGSEVSFSDPETAPVPAPIPYSSFHVRDASGLDYPDLLHVSTLSSSHTLFNRASGHTLTYDPYGDLTAVTRTFYKSTDCTGPSFAALDGPTLNGRLILSLGASPVRADALQVTGFATHEVTLRSQFTGNACMSFAVTLNRLTIVEPAALDVTDPLTLNLPIGVVP